MSRLGWLRLNAALVLASLLCLGGCSKSEPHLGSGVTIDRQHLPKPQIAGDDRYALVKTTDLPDLYDAFASTLSDLGLVKWDASFDCNHFASLYISVNQARYAVQRWHSSAPPDSLALAEVWYRPTPNSGHAIVAALTPEGLVYIEPQTGQRVTLTPEQEKSIFLVKW